MHKLAIAAALTASVAVAAIGFASTTQAAGRNGNCPVYYGCIAQTGGGGANSGGVNGGGSGGGSGGGNSSSTDSTSTSSP